MSEDQDNESTKQDEIDLKAQIAKDLSTLSERAVKGRITRLNKRVDQFEETLNKMGLPWHPTWKDVCIEGYFENRHLIKDPIYVRKVEDLMRRLAANEKEYAKTQSQSQSVDEP